MSNIRYCLAGSFKAHPPILHPSHIFQPNGEADTDRWMDDMKRIPQPRDCKISLCFVSEGEVNSVLLEQSGIGAKKNVTQLGTKTLLHSRFLVLSHKLHYLFKPMISLIMELFSKGSLICHKGLLVRT